MDWNKQIGTAIRRVRKDARMTQADLAESAGVGQGGVSKIEAGGQGLTFASLARMAAALGTTGSAILAEAERGGPPAAATSGESNDLTQLHARMDGIERLVQQVVLRSRRHPATNDRRPALAHMCRACAHAGCTRFFRFARDLDPTGPENRGQVNPTSCADPAATRRLDRAPADRLPRRARQRKPPGWCRHVVPPTGTRCPGGLRSV